MIVLAHSGQEIIAHFPSPAILQCTHVAPEPGIRDMLSKYLLREWRTCYMGYQFSGLKEAPLLRGLVCCCQEEEKDYGEAGICQYSPELPCWEAVVCLFALCLCLLMNSGDLSPVSPLCKIMGTISQG